MTEKLLHDPADIKERIRNFDESYPRILERLERAAERSGRKPADIRLLAATKTQPAPVVNHAIRAGIRYIGENRVQEYLARYDALQLEGISRHFIGHLQTNKVKSIVDKVDMIESVDSVRLAEAIGGACGRLGKTMPILLEVNIGGESNKSGIAPVQLEDTIGQISQIPGVNIQGLMAIPPICDTEREIRHYFEQMRQLFIDMRAKKIDNSNMVYLSMGMSGDFDTAIESGANLVRLGTALFGQRLYV